MHDVELAEIIVKKALEKGADEADTIIVSSNKHSIEFTGKGITSYRYSSETIVGIRVVIDKRIAVTSTNIASPHDIDMVVESAISIAKASKPDERWRGVAPSLGFSNVEGVYDKKTAEVSPEELVDNIKYLVSKTTEYSDKVRVSTSKFEVGSARYTIANSNDAPVSRISTGAMLFLEATAEDEGNRSTGSSLWVKKRLDQISFEMATIEAASKAVKFLKARPVETGVYNVVLTEKVFADALSVMLAGPISADWVIEGRSPFAGKLGEQVFDGKISIKDNSLMPWGVGSREFDDEGVATRNISVVEKGVLKNFLYDTYTAGIHGKESTGNAHRAPSSRPRPAPNNIICLPGDASMEEMVEKPGTLVVYDTVGLWLSNPVSGQFNATVTHGILYDTGGNERYVKGVILSADFWDIMRKKVRMIGKTIDNLANYYAPAILVGGIHVSGK